MTRSRLPIKVILLVSGIGLAAATIAGSQPSAARSYLDEYPLSRRLRIRSKLQLYPVG
jgi:hypothetical protein